MNSVEDLDVFKLAHHLTLKVYSMTKTFPKEETFSLVDQMRRAAASPSWVRVSSTMWAAYSSLTIVSFRWPSHLATCMDGQP